MLRNVLSVIIGYAIWSVIFLGGVAIVRAMFPDAHDAAGITSDSTALTLNICFSVIASIVSGLVATKIGSASTWAWGWILAGCLLATGIGVQFTAGIQLPVWYNLTFLYSLVPVTMFGVWIGLAKPKNKLSPA